MAKRKAVVLFLILVMGLSLAGCKTNPREEVRGFEKWTMVRNAYMIFPDGEWVSQWKDETGERESFLLKDGTELMQTSVITRYEPETTKKGLVGLEGLTEEVQKTIRSYYEEQGTLFSKVTCLKNAYADYCECAKNGERFTAHVVRQEVMPTAENDVYVTFLTAVTLPKQEHFTGDTTCRYDGRIFSREDGSQMDLKSLFVNEDWDAVKKELSMLCANDDTTISDPEIYDTMDQADILVFQDYLEIWFPYGTWERQEFDKGFGLKYERMSELLQEWAIPSNGENKEV